MDLLFKRYASPFILLDNLILAGRLDEFVLEFFKLQSDDKTWEFFLHKVFDKSYVEFRNDIETTAKNESMSNEQIETTVKEAQNILKNFKPTD